MWMIYENDINEAIMRVLQVITARSKRMVTPKVVDAKWLVTMKLFVPNVGYYLKSKYKSKLDLVTSNE